MDHESNSTTSSVQSKKLRDEEAVLNMQLNKQRRKILKQHKKGS